MATFTKANDWPKNVQEAANVASDTFRIVLSNTAPGSETPNPLTDGNGVLANITQISYTNYADDLATDRVLENVTNTTSSGVATFNADDVVITATGGALATFRYVYVVDDTVTSPADPIVGVWDHGSAISLASGESVTIQWNASGLYSLT